MSGDTKVIIGVIVATGILLVGAVAWMGGGSRETVSDQQEIEQVNLEIRDNGYNAKGTEEPLVTLVEYSDFECPACGSTFPVLKQLMEEYGEKVRLVYQHFPLPQHTQARMAAQAAEAAGAQGKFWEMHDLLFENQKELSKDLAKDLAGRIEGLDVEKFNQEFDDGVYDDIVLADLAAGNRAGVSSTPAIYINNIPYTGNRDYETMSNLLNQMIATLSQVGVPADGTNDKMDLGVNDEATGGQEIDSN